MDASHLYADPHVYDVLHDAGTRGDVSRFARIAARVSPELRGVARLVWLEPASGSGRYLVACAARGDVAVGVDLSAEMVRYSLERARELATRGTKTRGRARGAVGAVCAPMERFDARRTEWAGTRPSDARLRAHIAFNPINSIRHLGSDRAMLAHLACMAEHLHPRGVYIVGLSLSAYGLETTSEDVWTGRRGGLRVTQVVQYEPPAEGLRGAAARRERVISHLTMSVGGREEHRDSSYWLRTYDLAQWRAIVARAGWTIAGVFDNTGRVAVASEPGYFLFVLRPART